LHASVEAEIDTSGDPIIIPLQIDVRAANWGAYGWIGPAKSDGGAVWCASFNPVGRNLDFGIWSDDSRPGKGCFKAYSAENTQAAKSAYKVERSGVIEMVKQ
jgi:hypothetical protein